MNNGFAREKILDKHGYISVLIMFHNKMNTRLKCIVPDEDTMIEHILSCLHLRLLRSEDTKWEKLATIQKRCLTQNKQIIQTVEALSLQCTQTWSNNLLI